jgi:hypothetical protein
MGPEAEGYATGGLRNIFDKGGVTMSHETNGDVIGPTIWSEIRNWKQIGLGVSAAAVVLVAAGWWFVSKPLRQQYYEKAFEYSDTTIRFNDELLTIYKTASPIGIRGMGGMVGLMNSGEARTELDRLAEQEQLALQRLTDSWAYKVHYRAQPNQCIAELVSRRENYYRNFRPMLRVGIQSSDDFRARLDDLRTLTQLGFQCRALARSLREGEK